MCLDINGNLFKLNQQPSVDEYYQNGNILMFKNFLGKDIILEGKKVGGELNGDFLGSDKDFTYVYNNYPKQLTIHGEDFETTLYY